MTEPLLIFGFGGHARECAWIARMAASRVDHIVFVQTDVDPPRAQGDHRVLSLEDARAKFPTARYVVGIGDPRVRRDVAAVADGAGFEATSILHRSALIEASGPMPPGTVIFANVVISCDVRLAPHVHLNFGSSISHDSVVGAFSTVSPGVRIAGNVHVGAGVLVGIGASVLNGRPGAPLRIGDGATIGAGACVIGSVAAGAVVVGVPARAIKAPRPE